LISKLPWRGGHTDESPESWSMNMILLLIDVPVLSHYCESFQLLQVVSALCFQ
jgi:hypothetical protein